MTELKYDPELPFVLLIPPGLMPMARFRNEGDAMFFQERLGVGEVIDTTPKPKIPEDARFLHWFVGGGNFIAVRENFNPLKPWELEGAYYSEADLLEQIEDAEVTVLVRKGEA